MRSEILGCDQSNINLFTESLLSSPLRKKNPILLCTCSLSCPMTVYSDLLGAMQSPTAIPTLRRYEVPASWCVRARLFAYGAVSARPCRAAIALPLLITAEGGDGRGSDVGAPYSQYHLLQSSFCHSDLLQLPEERSFGA